MAAQPTGTVTLLFSDIEGSTRLLRQLGVERYASALELHRSVLRQEFARGGGYEVDYEGDGFFVAFARAQAAVETAAAAQRALAEVVWPEGVQVRVRIGIHTGSPLAVPPKYAGLDVHRAARIMAAAHGGQVVLSEATASLLQGRSLRDLGSHRLKDFEDPVRLFQVDALEFPPLRTVANTNLPLPLSSFVGRSRELEEAEEMLRSWRLLTVVGPGGVGKTRFAVELARAAVERRFADYPDGAFAVFLAPLTDSRLVLAAVSQALGAGDDLAGFLERRRMLVLLDNFEHLAEAAPALADLLERAPQLTLLVTSRELLRVRGERAFQLPPLDDADAAELFCDRADITRTEVVEELCRRLDGLPLAVELAAARASLLSPQALLDRLGSRLDLLRGGRDSDARHATLRATIEWSHELLTAAEQQLFRRLSVFAGGWELEAAEEVVAADLALLGSLMDKSLVRRSGERFWMLETIRGYAEERLEVAADADEVRRRHAAFFSEAVCAGEPELRMPGQTARLAWFAREQGNIRQTLDYLAVQPDAAGEGRLAGACWYYWVLSGAFREGHGRLEPALARAAGTRAEVRAILHDGLCATNGLLGELEAAQEHAQESLEIRENIDDQHGLLRSLLNLGATASIRRDSVVGVARLEQCAKLARHLGDDWFLALALADLGSQAIDDGDYERARALQREALALLDRIGDPLMSAATVANLASAELELGHYEEARRLFVEVLEHLLAAPSPEIVVWCLDGLAAVAARTGESERGARLHGAAERAANDLGYSLLPLESVRYKHTRELLTVALGTRAADLFAAGRELEPDEATAEAITALREVSASPAS